MYNPRFIKALKNDDRKEPLDKPALKKVYSYVIPSLLGEGGMIVRANFDVTVLKPIVRSPDIQNLAACQVKPVEVPHLSLNAAHAINNRL